jgi:AcrR family transcriptional regulator
MALVGGDFSAQERARGLLARLGELIVQSKDAPRLFADAEDLAMFTLAMRAKEESSWTVPRGGQLPPMPESDGVEERDLESAWRAAGMVRQSKREVPDLRAAIAELCDELLEVKPIAAAPKRKRANPGALWHDAVKTLKLMRQAGQDPSDHEIAKALGVSKATFSRHVGSKSTWTDERAGRLGTAKRQASRDPDTWGDR